MPHSQLIHDLLDGELDSVGEATLFGRMANDSELRSEFMQQLAIRTAIQQDRATLVPPISLTSAVFAGLGFSAPFAGAVGASAVSQSSGIVSTWLAKIGVAIMAALAAAGITYTIMQQQGSAQPSAVQPTAYEEAETPSPMATSSKSGSVPADAKSREYKTVERIVERIVERPSSVNVQLAEENDQLRSELAALRSKGQSDREDAVVEDRPVSVAPVEFTSNIQIARSPDNRVIRAMGIQPISPSFSVPNFSLSMRGLNGQAAPLSVPAQSAWYQNVGVGLSYRLSPSTSVGLEVGAESFPMVFQGTRNQQVVQFELQPLATWAGVSYRHVFSEIGSSGFAPFAQALVGGSEFGPLGRASAGIIYSPAGPLQFMVGFEGAALAFSHQNTWFTSTKIGLTYGVLVRL